MGDEQESGLGAPSETPASSEPSPSVWSRVKETARAGRGHSSAESRPWRSSSFTTLLAVS
jgi:hypothetical protein